jgi:hypothetical protein
MKKYMSQLVVVLLLFVLFYQAITHYETRLSQITYQQFEILQNDKKVKKVAYAEGEYEKEIKKWKKELQTLFEKVTENMSFSFEQIVLQNYLQYGQDYRQLGKVVLQIEPPTQYQKLHQSIINETFQGVKLCEAYLNRINQFDTIFVKLFRAHFVNTVLLKNH